jgi:hypothetical protein
MWRVPLGLFLWICLGSLRMGYPAGSSALMALIPVSRVLGGFRPLVVCVSRACVVPGGSAARSPDSPVGLPWPARFVVYSVMRLVGPTPRSWRRSGAHRVWLVQVDVVGVDASLCPVEALSVSGHWPHSRFCAPGGLTEQRGWVVQGDH